VVCAALGSGEARGKRAQAVIGAGGVISVQVLNEFVNVLRRKLGRTWDEVAGAEADIRELCSVIVPLTLETHGRALRVARRYDYRFFDARMIASALEASCDVLYSEDLQDGQKIGGFTIRNPFRGTA
jgi:predicted nucleic acid-binding protein